MITTSVGTYYASSLGKSLASAQLMRVTCPGAGEMVLCVCPVRQRRCRSRIVTANITPQQKGGFPFSLSLSLSLSRSIDRSIDRERERESEREREEKREEKRREREREKKKEKRREKERERERERERGREEMHWLTMDSGYYENHTASGRKGGQFFTVITTASLTAMKRRVFWLSFLVI